MVLGGHFFYLLVADFLISPFYPLKRSQWVRQSAWLAGCLGAIKTREGNVFEGVECEWERLTSHPTCPDPPPTRVEGGADEHLRVGARAPVARAAQGGVGGEGGRLVVARLHREVLVQPEGDRPLAVVCNNAFWCRCFVKKGAVWVAVTGRKDRMGRCKRS